MICPICGRQTGADGGQCPACGLRTLLGADRIVMGATGLPAATLGPSRFSDVRTVDSTLTETIAVRTEYPPPVAAPGPLRDGQLFGPRYRIIRLLGAGGMGAVYQARDAELGVTVAVKVILSDLKRGGISHAAEERFKNELLLARKVTHKHVVRIHD